MKIHQKLIIFSAAVLAFPTALIIILFRILNYRTYFANLGITDIAKEQPVTRVLAENYSSILIICTIVCVFLIMITGVIFLKGILKPLKMLQNAAKEIENGNLDYEIHYPYDDDYTTVFMQFDRMRMHLKDLLWERVEQEKNRTELLASIAHDLKTPITSIQGYAQALSDGIANNPEKEERYLQTIIQKANDLNRMADTLYSFSRLELNQMDFDMELVDICVLIRDLSDESVVNQENVIHFDYRLDIASPSLLLLDVGLFRRVFTNIVLNSIKYKRNDIVHLSLHVYENSTHIIFCFADDGIGVTDEDLEKIFNRFYRSDRARQNTGNGSGLGLSICSQIIQSFHGHIWALHNQPNGLRIFISLPKIREAI